MNPSTAIARGAGVTDRDRSRRQNMISSHRTGSDAWQYEPATNQALNDRTGPLFGHVAWPIAHSALFRSSHRLSRQNRTDGDQADVNVAEEAVAA